MNCNSPLLGTVQVWNRNVSYPVDAGRFIPVWELHAARPEYVTSAAHSLQTSFLC